MQNKKWVTAVLVAALAASATGNVVQFNQYQKMTDKLSETQSQLEAASSMEETIHLLETELEQIKTTAQESNIDNLIKLSDLTNDQLQLFKDTAHYFIENILLGETPAQIHTQQEFILESFIMENELPQNALLLFKEWKDSVNYDTLLVEWAESQGTQVDTSTSTQTPAEIPDEEIVDKPINTPQQQNKPQPSPQQQQQQQQGNTSSGYKGATGEPYTYVNQYGVTIHVNEYGVEQLANENGYWDASEETGGAENQTARALVAMNPGLTYEEAIQRIRSGDLSGLNTTW